MMKSVIDVDDDQKENDDDGNVYIMKKISKVNVEKEILHEIQTEISLLRTLDHPNVVRVYETFQDSKTVYIIMEYLKGGDLLSRKGYTEAEAAEILLQICSAIAYCHSNNVMHRDLKCENVIFDNDSNTKNDDDDDETQDLRVTLIDFGLSLRYKKMMTDFCGSLYTMAPEILKRAYTEKADMWSIGVIAYILLSGRRPYTAQTEKELMNNIYYGDPIFYDGLEWEHISEDAKQFVQSLLQYDPSSRKSAAEALQSPWLQKYHNAWHQQGDNDTSNGHITMNKIEKSLVQAHSESKFRKVAKMIIAYRYQNTDLTELREAFDMMDADNDGTITYNEFKEALSSNSMFQYTDAELKEIFQDLDVSETGGINYTEFLASTIEARGEIEDSKVAAAFDKLDVENTGYITKEALMKVLNDNYRAVDGCSSSVEEILTEVDKDGDGKISYKEFLSLFRRQSKGNGGVDY